MDSWYMILIRPAPKEDGEQKQITLPQMNSMVCHRFAGIAEDDTERQKKLSEKNPFWDLFQDGARPTWAPDFWRLGYSVVWRRDGLAKNFVKMDIKNPKNVKKTAFKSRKRVLTFDDVWAVPVTPVKTPIPMPDMKLKGAEWWAQTREQGTPHEPYLSPGGCKVMGGATRLSDVIYTMVNGLHMHSDDTLLQLKDDDLNNILTTYTPETGMEGDNVTHPMNMASQPGNTNRTRQAHTSLFRTGIPDAEYGGGYGYGVGMGYGLFYASADETEE